MFFIVVVVVAILDHVLGKWIIKTTRALGTRAKKLLPTNTTARARKCVKNEVTGTTPVALKRFFFLFFFPRDLMYVDCLIKLHIGSTTKTTK